jgi:hypothetical protein
METTKIYNLIILDKSGSMENIKEQAISGYNETLGTIRSAQLRHLDTQEHFVSLAVFCSCGTQMIYDRTPIKDAENLTSDKYQPCCCTPLFDAIGMSVQNLRKAIENDKTAAVLVTIITDGLENSSMEWNRISVQKLIEECKGLGWNFAYIGADHNVEEIAEKLSINNTSIFEKSDRGVKSMWNQQMDAMESYYCMLEEECAMPCMSDDARVSFRQSLSKNYFKK